MKDIGVVWDYYMKQQQFMCTAGYHSSTASDYLLN